MRKYWHAFCALVGRPCIVEFRDGKFGVRKGIIIKEYLDLQDRNQWWFGLEYANKYCKDTLEIASTALAELPPWWFPMYKFLRGKDTGVPIALKFKD